ncbi:hypothetical protein WG907_14500 [Sphingobium sp. AN558]|uniref:hypothetical protein n=1 Tax=Sphingobium sp. AN558 TaxID=3133442 RepID=UPI0030BBDA9B
MRTLPFAAFAVFGAAALATAPPPHVPAKDVKLKSVTVELPFDDSGFPAGPDADIVTASCTACHSASMALTQPALSPGQWKTIVVKMRDVYHAPVRDEDIPRIVDYLSANKAAGTTAR